MTTVASQVLIRVPLPEVFEVASDWRHWAEWFAGTSVFCPLGEPARGTGARYAYRARVLGMAWPVETEISDFVENSGWTGVSRRGPEHRTSWRFTAEGADTRFVFSMDYRIPLLPGWLDRLLVRPMWQQLVEQSTRNLKRRLEAGRPARPTGAASVAAPASPGTGF